MKRLLTNFLNCGILGWCIEIIFTSLDSLKKRDYKLMGNTSIWMFPIYGCLCFLYPVYLLTKKMPWFFRGVLYTLMIFSGEYVFGRWLQKKNCCPWDYSRSRFHFRRLIRLDYAPLWFLVGLLYEKFLFGKGAS